MSIIISSPTWVEYMSGGFRRAGSSPPESTAPTSIGLFNFYQEDVLNDGTVLETLIHENISGYIEADMERRHENTRMDDLEILYCLIPDIILSPIAEGMKVVDKINTYVIKYYRDYETSQEIYMIRR